MKQTLAILALVATGLWLNAQRSKVAYADTACPRCGSNEVLDLGQTNDGLHRLCYDCKVEFYEQKEIDK